MGRKIPGKKHRGVKDPLEQLAKRNESLKNKINAPPGNPDEQELPKSVIELNRLRQMVKDGIFSKKKRNKRTRKNLLDTSKFYGVGPQLPGMTQKDKGFPNLQQKDGESETSFLGRVNLATEEIIKEANIEKKYGISINRDSRGTIENINCDQIKAQSNKKNNLKLKNKTKSNPDGEKTVKLNRKQRIRLKKSNKKRELAQAKMEIKMDTIKFGEVVHEPPHLRVRPKGTTATSFDKPGTRNLLLNKIINSSTNKKEISISQQRLLDKRREDVINAYRKYKSTQIHSKNF